jgi:hypothetical protein
MSAIGRAVLATAPRTASQPRRDASESCAVGIQTSLRDSVHQLLRDKIEALHLSPWFRVTREGIFCPATGSSFRFIGLRNNPAAVRSAEGVTKRAAKVSGTETGSARMEGKLATASSKTPCNFKNVELTPSCSSTRWGI